MLCLPLIAAAQPPEGEPRILFFGLWDRAYAQTLQASEQTGVPVQIRGIEHCDTPGDVAKQIDAVDLTTFDLIYVLQIDVTEAHLLVEPLRRAKQANPALRVVQLDRRGSQQELIDAGVLEVDPQVHAYWRGFGLENLKRLLVYSNVTYLGEDGEVSPPVPAAPAGLYHPDAPGMFDTWSAYEQWYRSRTAHESERQLVAIFIQQDYVVYGNTRVYDALISELESRGVDVAPMFGGRDALQAMLRECKPDLLMLQHHSGPEEQPEDGKPSFLEELDVPYVYSAGMMSGLTVDEWRKDVRGLKMAGYGALNRHELYGIIEPHLIGAGGTSSYGFALDEPIPERVKSMVDRVMGWLALRTIKATDKKIAAIYFHKYLGKADVGRPAPEMSRYLDPHASLLELLKALGREGYDVGTLPESTEALLEQMKRGGRNVPNWAAGDLATLLEEGDPVLVPESQYLEWYEQKLSPQARADVETSHGPPPGRLMVTEREGVRYIVLPCLQYGNVLLAPQPDRGSLQDGDLVHSRIVPPPHNYLAFYWWLQEIYHADVMVHFGTHGSDFYLPGKELFLSGDCYPDVIVGGIPNFYVWTLQNIGEAIIAKRRSYSVIVDHGVPPILEASRDAEANDLIELLDQLGKATASQVQAAIAKDLSERLRASSFWDELRLTLADDGLLTEAQIQTASTYLRHARVNNVVHGMHVLGVAPTEEKMLPFVEHIVARNTKLHEKLTAAGVEGDVTRIARLLLDALLVRGGTTAEAAARVGVSEAVVRDELADETALARRAWDGLKRTPDELANLLDGIDGRFVPPGPGGDPILRPEALPTGRNMYGVAPQEIPTRQAWELAKLLTDDFLAKFHDEQGRYPQKLAFSMTGMETFRNMGVMEAQVLYLLGVEPEWSPGGRIAGLRVMSRETLGRPRVDVVMSVNGIYLKDFAPCVRLLDEAVQLATACEEEDNVVRTHAKQIAGQLRQMGVDEARAAQLGCARAIGSTPGGGGARLVWFLPRSGTWQERREIVDLWRTMRTHVYTGDVWGEQLPELHDMVYAGTEGVITNWSDNLLGPLTNHHYPEETGGLALSVHWITGKKPSVAVFDLRRNDQAGAMSLEEVLSLELRAAAFNREWIVGQMEHNYIGATQFMQIVDNTFQWEAVRAGAVWPGTWDKLVDVYVRDSFDLNLRQWFDQHNPFAFQELTATLLEASRKGYWTADPETVRQVAVAHAESVARFGHGAGPYAGGNAPLRSLLAATLSRPGDEALRKTYLEKVDAVEEGRSAAAPPQASAPLAEPGESETVAGQRMQETQVAPDAPPANGPPTRAWPRYWGIGLAAAVLLLIGYRLRVGGPGHK